MKLQCQTKVVMYTVVTYSIKRVWYQKPKTVLGNNIDKHNLKYNSQIFELTEISWPNKNYSRNDHKKFA